MKTDKELLELAAKAAGVVGEWVDDYNPTHDYFYHGNQAGIYAGDFIDGSCTVWNPLTDDGDALRLAVKLNIDFYFNDSKAGAWINDLTCLTEDINDDKHLATRRVIVRAAAAIGEAK